MQNNFMPKASIAFLAGLVLSVFSGNLSAQNMFRKASDFDGDGKADFAVTRNVGALKYWWIWQTTAGQLAIWRPGAQAYYWGNGSQSGIFIFPWGTSGDAAITY